LVRDIADPDIFGGRHVQLALLRRDA